MDLSRDIDSSFSVVLIIFLSKKLLLLEDSKVVFIL